MLQALAKRLNKKEDGFTLIELMVVVLIIGILIAIAIPAFLGAQTRAQDRAAQATLRNSMTNARAVYTDTSSYPAQADLIVALNEAEPNITHGTASTEPDEVKVLVTAVAATVDVPAHDLLTLSALSQTGECWFMTDARGAISAPAKEGTCA